MKSLLTSVLLPGLMAIFGVVALVIWTGIGPRQDLQARIPGLDRPPKSDVSEIARPLVGKLQSFGDKPSELPGSWPRFRGERFDGIGQPGLTLARKWPDGGPKKYWKIELGEGHAGAAVFAGRVYVHDYDRAAAADAVRCFSLDDGQEIWRFSYPDNVKRNHGMSRTVPAVTEKYLVALGPKCHVSCLDPKTGKCFWLIDMVDKFGATVPPWYAGQCPLIDNDRAILAPGGESLLVALDCKTGEIVWKSKNPQAWTMTHSSIVPMEFAGKKMYVYCGKGGVAGVATDDGEILWETNEWKISIATCPSPIVLPAGKIFCSGGYNSGAMMLQLVERNGKIDVKKLFKLAPGVFGSTQQTPIFFDGHIYGVREKDKQLVCLDLNGKEVWKSGSEHRFGLGPYLIADGLIYVLDDSGLLTLAQASPKGYQQLAESQVIVGHDSWAPMALAGSRLILRDLTQMACIEVGE
ncbi:MAG: PQQ-like beta-propeller repeat protein [Pirellulales bacterium]|nr:PQQ-like beta-propeller repeat protein [Pirellulales bacterium]